MQDDLFSMEEIDNIKVKKSHPWTAERVARLGFLMGLGWDVKRIAQDFIIHSTPANVYRHAQKFGLSFRTANVMGVPFPESFFPVLDEAALRRGITRERLVQYLLETIVREPILIDNILDDLSIYNDVVESA